METMDVDYQPTKEKKRKASKIAVKILKTAKGSSLVKWTEKDGAMRMGYIPTETIEKDGAEGEVLEMAIPYGVPWEALELPNLTVKGKEMLCSELHRLGIWTAEDLRKKTVAVLGAINNVSGLSLAALLNFAKNYEEV